MFHDFAFAKILRHSPPSWVAAESDVSPLGKPLRISAVQ
jgi:hypothetical protein